METTTATKNNLQIVQQGFDNFAKGNISAIIDVCTDDVEWGSYNNPDVTPSGTYHGKKGVQDFFSTLAQNINYSSFEPRDFLVQGDNVVVFGHHTGTVKSTGKTFDHDWCMRFKMDDGKIEEYFSFVDTYDQAKAFK